jgi:hypothetical protein
MLSEQDNITFYNKLLVDTKEKIEAALNSGNIDAIV